MRFGVWGLRLRAEGSQSHELDHLHLDEGMESISKWKLGL